MKFVAIFCIVIGLVACTGKNSPTPIFSDTEVKILVTATSTTAIPSPTTTQIPVSTPTATQTPIPTSTNPPTLTPSPAETPVLSTLPDWFSEPTANILILGNKGNPRVTIFNAETGDLQVVNEYPVRKAIEEGRKNEPNTDQDTLSPNGRYQVNIIRQDDGIDSVIILDNESNTESELFNPFLHHITRNEDFNEYAEAHWSPNGEFLSVQYEKHYYSDNFDKNLVIYKPSGEIYRQYANMHTAWRSVWSPNAPFRILYTKGWTPCILDVVENNNTCLDQIRNWQTIEKMSPVNYRWSPDSNQISFIFGNSDSLETGVCYIDVEAYEVICFTSPESIHIDQQHYARFQYWSYDGKYIVSYFDEFGAYAHVIGDSFKVAIVDIDDNNLILLDEYYRHSPLENPWRPPLSIQTD